MNCLPDEIKLVVLSYLEPIDVLNYNLTCSELNRIRPTYFDDPYRIGDVFRLKRLGCEYSVLAKHGHYRLLSKSKVIGIYKCISIVCELGHLDSIKALIKSSSDMTYNDVVAVVRSCNMDSIKYLHKIVPELIQTTFAQACSTGSDELFDYYIEHGGNLKLVYPSNTFAGGNMRIIKTKLGSIKMSDQDVFSIIASNSEMRFEWAYELVRNNHLELFKQSSFIMSLESINYLVSICKSPAMLRYLISIGASETNYIVETSCNLSDVEIFSKWYDGMMTAPESVVNCLDICKIVVGHSSFTTCSQMLGLAYAFKKRDVVDYLRELGITVTGELMRACLAGYLDIADELLNSLSRPGDTGSPPLNVYIAVRYRPPYYLDIPCDIVDYILDRNIFTIREVIAYCMLSDNAVVLNYLISKYGVGHARRQASICVRQDTLKVLAHHSVSLRFN